MPYNTITHYVLFFGCSFSFILAVSQVVSKKPELANYLNSATCFCNAIIQLGIFLWLLRIPESHPGSLFGFFPSLFLIGPCILLHSYTLFNGLTSPRELPKKLLSHLIPGFLLLLAEIVFQICYGDVVKTIIDTALNRQGWGVFTLLCLAGAIHMSFYYLVMIIQGFSVRDSEIVRVPIRIMIAVYIGCMLSALLVSLGFFGKRYELLAVGGALIPLVNMMVFLSNYRYPSFFRLIEGEIKKKKYEKSQLYGIDKDLLSGRLRELMTVDRLYNDFDITLEKLSGLLMITPHQLSQLLNEQLKMNFWQFINSYRIEEAKKLLVNNPDQSIISICYKVGFGSKSTFNDTFRKFTGENPREYRNRHS